MNRWLWLVLVVLWVAWSSCAKYPTSLDLGQEPQLDPGWLTKEAVSEPPAREPASEPPKAEPPVGREPAPEPRFEVKEEASEPLREVPAEPPHDSEPQPGDAGVTDARPTDAGPPDAGPTDAGPTDAGPTDAGSTDAQDAGAPPEPPTPDAPREGKPDGPDSPAKYPLDHSLRFNHIQVLGTHNSYHVAPGFTLINDWKYTHEPLDVQLKSQGIRQFELDLYWNGFRNEYEVYHVPLTDTGSRCKRFRNCLKTLKTWSDQNRKHMPLTVLIEPKGILTYPRDGLKKMEAEILKEWPKDRIITPDFVRGSRKHVKEAIEKDGWPTLARLRGKVMFAIMLTGGPRESYSNKKKNLHGRLMFIGGRAVSDFEVVVLMDDPQKQLQDIQKAVKAGFLVRTRADAKIGESKANNDKRLAAALRSGAHFISTDYPAKDKKTGYIASIPGGAPARCNPIAAPKACTSKAIEDGP